MLKNEILVRSHMSMIEVEDMLASWALHHLAEVKPMGRLMRRYKTEGESLHWHISGLRKGMGTVEVTYLPSRRRLTVLVHDNRRGSWAGDSYVDLAEEIKKRKGV